MNIFRALLLTICTYTLSTLAIPFESSNFVVGEPEISDFRLNEEKDLLLLGLADGRLIGKKASTGEVQFTIAAQDSAIKSIDLNKACTHALTCGKDSTMKIWDLTGQSLLKEIVLDTIEPQGRFISHDSLVYAPHSGIVAAVFSDVQPALELGKETRAFALSEDNTLFLKGNNLYNMQTGELVTAGKTSFDIQTAGAISPDNKYYAIGNNNSMVKVLDAVTGDSIAYMEKIGFNTIYSLAFSRDNKKVFIGSSGGYTALWEFSSNDKCYSDDVDKSCTNLAVSQDGKTYYALCEDEIRTWQTSGDNVSLSMKSNLASSYSTKGIGYTHNGEQILYEKGGKTYLSNSSTGAIEGSIDTTVDSLFLIPGSNNVLTFYNGQIDLIDTIGDSVIFSSPKYTGGKYKTTVMNFQFSPDGTTAAIVYGRWNTWDTKAAGTTLHYVDLKEGTIVKSQELSYKARPKLSFTGDGKILAANTSDTVITLWDIPTLEPISQLIFKEPTSISYPFWSGDDQKLFVLLKNDSLARIDRASMKIEKCVSTNKYGSMNICYSAKSGRIFVPVKTSILHVYDLNLDLVDSVYTNSFVRQMKCSHDGRLLYILTDNTLSFYDTKTLEEKVQYTVPNYTHISCFFSPTKDEVVIGNEVYTGVFDVSQYVPILNLSKGTPNNHLTFSSKLLSLKITDTSQPLSLHLYSPQGKLVDKRVVNSTENTVEMNQNLATGIYFYSVSMGSQVVQQGRVRIP